MSCDKDFQQSGDKFNRLLIIDSCVDRLSKIIRKEDEVVLEKIMKEDEWCTIIREGNR